jgi:hypothetical protein
MLEECSAQQLVAGGRVDEENKYVAPTIIRGTVDKVIFN